MALITKRNSRIRCTSSIWWAAKFKRQRPARLLRKQRRASLHSCIWQTNCAKRLSVIVHIKLVALRKSRKHIYPAIVSLDPLHRQPICRLQQFWPKDLGGWADGGDASLGKDHQPIRELAGEVEVV